MIAEAEIWQVMCSGEIYQAELDTLKEWIAEGVVQPSDQVRKGNLRWIEAGRVPALRRVFSGEEVITPAPHDANAAHAATSQHAEPVAAHLPVYAAPAAGATAYGVADAPPQQFDAWPTTQDNFDATTTEHFGQHASSFQHAAQPTLSLAPGCFNHPQAAPVYICRVCQSLFCAKCPKFVENSRTALCARCGDLCSLYEDVRAQEERLADRTSGFGIGDFAQAIRYPFRNTIGLVGMSVLYALLLLAGWRGQLIAYVVLFGCISLVIKQVAWGRLDRSFLPDFSAFSLWDDLVMPCLLGVGVTIVTIGPAIVLVVALLFGWLSGASSNSSRPHNSAAPLAAPDAVATAEEQQQEQHLSQQGESQITEQEFADFVNSSDPQKDAEFARKVERMRAEQYRAVVTEQEKRESDTMRNVISAFRNSPGLLLFLALVALAWAFFYYPMALAVAGFTEDFMSVVNPLVGLDTIRRMGGTYAKAFLMYVAVQVCAMVLSFVIALVTAPFDMPMVGNLPGRFMQGIVAFYFNLVIACLLGLALYKSADRLDLATD
ncbi:MAG TPA: hypothetical protein VK363_17085 [Pyrinomonadaceae bacterium]|nr:hypothetical protein [Pyrinomonadaceae bacterium]